MNQNSVVYTYGYPYTWGSANYNVAYYPYATPSRRSLPPPAATAAPRQKTSKRRDDKKISWLLIAVIVLAILLLIAIIGLIALGVLYQEARNDSAAGESTTTSKAASGDTTTVPVTTQPPPTVIGFNVTQLDLTYDQSMDTPNSAAFNNTNYQICDMIVREWLENKYKDICQCVKFYSGSVIATVHLTFENSLGKPDDLLNEMKSKIPTKSDTDTRTNKVDAEDIMIVS